MPDTPDEKHPTGPDPERLKIEGFESWEDAVRAGLKKPPPPGGWPERTDDKPPKDEQGRRPK
jgi:hypothetical protein